MFGAVLRVYRYDDAGLLEVAATLSEIDLRALGYAPASEVREITGWPDAMVRAWTMADGDRVLTAWVGEEV